MDVVTLLSILRSRPDDVHKGMVGRVAVVAGSSTMCGAALLVGKAALRSGSGLVYMCSTEDCKYMFSQVPELIFFPLSIYSGLIEANRLLDHYLDYNIDVCALGPGIGQSPDISMFVIHFIKSEKRACSVVLDADGLNSISIKDLQECLPNSIVCTPHMGEFKRLFPQFFLEGYLTDEQRKKMAFQAAQESKQIIVLKGARTIVANSDKVWVNNTGNSAMATAGMGDVLTGIIASFVGQGLSLFEAACLGVYVHGMVGDECFKFKSIGLLSSDIIEYLPTFFSNVK